MPVPDLDRTDYLLMLGANPYESNGSLCTAPDFPGRLEAIQARGGTVVVVDPRRTRTADEADEHVAIRPGTDAHLLLAMVHRPVRGGPGRRSASPGPHMRRRSTRSCGCGRAVHPRGRGRRHAASRPTTIRRLAREPRRRADGGGLRPHRHHTPSSFGTLASWRSTSLNAPHRQPRPARRGHVPAGRPLAAARGSRAAAAAFTIGRRHSRVQGLPEVRGELPVATLADEIETPGEGQVRALVTVAGNPVAVHPQQRTPRRGHRRRSTSWSRVDPYLNETTRHADVILPPPSALARGHYDLAFYSLAVRNVANYSAAGPARPGRDARARDPGPPRPHRRRPGAPTADPAIVDDLLFDGLLASVPDRRRARPRRRPGRGRDPGRRGRPAHPSPSACST